MIINHNIAALNTHRQLGVANTAQSKNMEKLSSGLRINRAGDDAAGLAISEKMRGQIRGLDMASRNAQDGISLIQTAEGALNETHSILQRMRELAVQAANDTNTDDDRAELQKEIDQLISEINRISTDTEFNTKKLLNGDLGKVAQITGGAGTSVYTNLMASGADLTGGSYTLTIADDGDDTVSVSSGDTAITDAAIADHITADAGAHVKYGSYTLTVTNFDETAGTADFELIGPDGQKSVVSGAAIDDELTIGGLVFAFDNEDVTSNGTVKFDFTRTNLDITLEGDKAVSIDDMTYSGGRINIGGFEFELYTNFGTGSKNITVIDKSIKFHIGANQDQNTSLSINNMGAVALGVDGVKVNTQESANTAITTVDEALKRVSAERAKLGAYQNRLEHTINNLGTSSENLTAAESRIRDVDMAKEIMEQTKNAILVQAAQAMLAQANQQPQGVLQLLQ